MMKKKPSLICATGNPEKFALGERAFSQYGIALQQIHLDIDEIQGEDAELIIQDKAQKAFSLLKQPVLVSDNSWRVPALGGFPGAYMKSMNQWFKPTDFIELMSHKKDKTIYLDRWLAYIDNEGVQIFKKTLEGKFVDEPRGLTGPSIMRVVTLEGDNGLTIAELFDQGLAGKQGMERDAWEDAAKWYASRIKDKA